MINEVKEVVGGSVELAKAMGVTLKYFFKKPVTNQFPDEPVAVYPRFRGRHVLKRYENGLERCIGCSLCAAACPTDCIYVEAAENTDEDRRSPGERYAKTYDINMLRCIFCGYCAEACPTEAIVLEHDFALAEYNRWDAIYTKERLLEPHDPPHVVVRSDEVFVDTPSWGGTKKR
ncbi:MAG: NADH-quinone oxidoreductase subunit NuoI [Anaerolineae bacterium]|nr:NADH-quinone oxidoreductase subunit NuoI [Anaerolineae bacterium]